MRCADFISLWPPALQGSFDHYTRVLTPSRVIFALPGKFNMAVTESAILDLII